MRDNPYYSPEKFGLTTVGEIEWEEPCYSFDTTVVLKDSNDVLYWASDQGCSCPMPFEDHDFPRQWRSGTFFDLADELSRRAGNDPSGYAAPQIVELLARLR